MIFSEIKPKIKNLRNFKSLTEIKKAGLRICRNTKTGSYWLIEGEFLKPIIKSPREVKTIVVRPEHLKYKVLMCHKSIGELKETYVLEYIKWGEKPRKDEKEREIGRFQKRPTCRSRSRWWDLGERQPAKVNVNYLINDVAKGYIGSFFVSDDFQELHTNKQLAYFINSTLFWLVQNLFGRTSFGGGLLKIQTYEFKKLIIPYDERLVHSFKNAFELLSTRPVKSAFEELGLPKPNRDYSNIDPKDVSLDKVMSDRRELDKIIFEALGLTEEEQLEVYRAVIELVKNRLVKARSV
jgi:hypothetical protein